MIRRDLRPSEILTIIFTGILLMISIIYKNRIENGLPILVPIYSSIMVIQFLRFPPIGRDILLPFISVVFIFDSLGWIVHPINPVDIDPILLELDYLLTGTYPTVALQKIMNPLLTEIMQIAYTSYYFIPLALGIVLKIHKKESKFEEALFLILLCFYLSYLGYILFPALGPRFYIQDLHTVELKGLFLTEPIHTLLNRLEGIKRDAFPSGHTAIALLCLFIAKKTEKRLFWILLPVVMLLIPSTVYLRYHYIVDVIGGVVLTIIVMIAGPRIYNLLKK